MYLIEILPNIVQQQAEGRSTIMRIEKSKYVCSKTRNMLYIIIIFYGAAFGHKLKLEQYRED
jgi:hypothetical protein